MLRGVILGLALGLLLIPLAEARSLVSFDDPPGDMQVVAGANGPPAPWASGIDLRNAKADWDNETLVATIRVENLAALDSTTAGAGADTLFVLSWTVQGTARDGSWSARADYMPSRAVAWSYSAEGPCLNARSGLNCPGSDRDIHDGLHGSANKATNNVQVLVPAATLNLKGRFNVSAFHAQAEEGWPTQAFAAGDWADDTNHTVVTIAYGPGPSSSAPTRGSKVQPTPIVPASVVVLVLAVAVAATRVRR